ncbi:ExbD/TolR family protein [Nannocystis pusilla]|uniref:ExbD/TolR family protein n=1 Tax=Nannocystis pusilla TaxID=889268 RepID=UPI003DA5A46E
MTAEVVVNVSSPVVVLDVLVVPVVVVGVSVVGVSNVAGFVVAVAVVSDVLVCSIDPLEPPTPSSLQPASNNNIAPPNPFLVFIAASSSPWATRTRPAFCHGRAQWRRRGSRSSPPAPSAQQDLGICAMLAAMPRPRALLLGLCLPLLACDAKAVEAQKARVQALEDRVQRLEAETAALTARMKSIDDERLRLEQLAKAPSLPPASGAPPASVVVEVRADDLRVGDEVVDLDRFEALLRERLGTQPGLALHVKADASVEYARVIEVMDRAKTAGVAKIAMVTDPALKP